MVRNSHILLVTYTGGYLTVESFFIITYTGFQTDIDKQTLIHHILGAANFYVAFWPNNFTLVMGVG